MTPEARALGLLAAPCLVAAAALAYPLDGYEATGIPRLEAYRRGAEGELPAEPLPPGARWTTAEVDLRLADAAPLEVPPPEPEPPEALLGALGGEPTAWSLSVLDLSDPARPLHLAHREDEPFPPGSVGKALAAAAFLDALARARPDPAARARLLRELAIPAGSVVRGDTHPVPFWRPGAPAVHRRPLRPEDRANLYTFLDWMLSNSSNAAANVIVRETVLLRELGPGYPEGREALLARLQPAPPERFAPLLERALVAPLRRLGIDTTRLRQGSFFGRTLRERMPGSYSVATARGLVDFALRMEQGRIVDRWSSRELKRLLYSSERRRRYAASQLLRHAAVVFKSGTLYSCAPDDERPCPRYRGTRRNHMSSIAVVEESRPEGALHYIAAVSSNTLGRNAEVAHQLLATRIHRLLVARLRQRTSGSRGAGAPAPEAPPREGVSPARSPR